MDLETYEYFDAPFPQEEELKAKLAPGVEIEYWKISADSNNENKIVSLI